MRLLRGVVSQSYGPPAPNFITATDFQDNPNAAVITFTSKDIGAADTNRRVAVFFAASGTKNHSGITSITIGGITATVYGGNTHSTTGSDFAGLAVATVPTGTTATIVFTIAGGGWKCRGMQIMVARLVGFNATPTSNVGQYSSASPSQSLTTATDGFAGGIFCIDTANTNIAWTNVTEKLESAGTTAIDASCAANSQTSSGSLTVSATSTGGTAAYGAFYAASFSPT